MIEKKDYWWIPFYIEISIRDSKNFVFKYGSLLKIFRTNKNEYENKVSLKLKSFEQIKRILFLIKKNENKINVKDLVFDLEKIQEMKSLNEGFLKNDFNLRIAQVTTHLVLKAFEIILKKIKKSKMENKKNWKKVKLKY